MSDPLHVPVLRDRVVELLAPSLAAPGAVLVDATLGLGGHAAAVLEDLPDVRVLGIDRDPEALRLTRERLAASTTRLITVEAVYDQVAQVVEDAGVGPVAGVLFDLGVSSMQLDVAERGFSYATDAPLDMRMGVGATTTAADVLNTYAVGDLARVLSWYGEEKFARRIAESVVAERADEPFTTSARLVALVRDAIPAAARRTGGNPAKRTFQALRIEVNDELAVLRRAVPAALGCVAVGGRVVSMAYHSLEDRIVKQAFTRVTTSSAPPDLPIVPDDQQPEFRLLTRGAEKASAAEVAVNSRARSVRLRAVERVREAA